MTATTHRTVPTASHHPRTKEEALKFHRHSEHLSPIIASIVAAQAIALFWLLFAMWPAATAADPTVVQLLWGVHWTVSMDVALIALVMTAGGLGAVTYEAQSLSYHRGNDDFLADWTLWYVLRPIVGAGLAGLVYFVSRGGLLQADTTADTLNVYGMVAVGGLAGLFATPSMTKLSKVFDSVLAASDDGPDDGDQPDAKPDDAG